MQTFSQQIFKIGVNPCVVPPETVMRELFEQSGKSKGPIPVRGTINAAPYKQTVVKFRGKWRLYINGIMLKAAGIDAGDRAKVRIEYDPVSRLIPLHPKLRKALMQNKRAKAAYDTLAPYRRKEINRYLSFAKSKETVEHNIEIIVRHLLGKKADTLHPLMRTKRAD